ncbi:hypothetical protein AGMMS49965_04750 [Bacteroidia bacterium]|nr:hypothetical protein AGMMS49965_04750 [Bacteroidia bacterium]
MKVKKIICFALAATLFIGGCTAGSETVVPDPTDPTNPTDPTDPTVPTDPSTPTDSTKVTVPVTGVALDKTSLYLWTGEREKLTPIVSPENADIKGWMWESSNPDVASVSNGMVTAIAVGNTTITVTTSDSEKKATATVTVGDNYNPGPGSTDAEMPVIVVWDAEEYPIKYAQYAIANPIRVEAYTPDGGTLTYQWYSTTSRTTDGATRIPSATTNSYTPSTTTSGTVFYYVEVTNTNKNATGYKTATEVCPYVEVIVTGTQITIGMDFGGAIVITGNDGQNVLSKNWTGHPGSLVLSATGYTDVAWYIDGNTAATAYGNSITINAADYGIRTHSVTFTGVRNNVPYSQVVPFKVVK